MSNASRSHQRIPLGHAGLALAIERAGGAAALGRAVGLTRFAVQMWKAHGVPANRAPAVSRITGIPLHELRPDLFDAPAAPVPGDPAQVEGAA